MKKKLIIGFVTLVSILILIIAMVVADHPSNTPVLKAQEVANGKSVNPILVLVNSPTTASNPNKFTVTLKLKNIGYVEWENSPRDIAHKLKIIDVLFTPYGSPTPDSNLPSSLAGLKNTFVNFNMPPGLVLNTGVDYIPGLHNDDSSRGSEELSGIATFVLPEIISPDIPGTISLKYKMYELTDEDGDGTFDDEEPFSRTENPFIYSFKVEKVDAECVNIGSGGSVRVFNPEYPPINIQGSDHEVLPGEQYEIRVKLKNTGTVPWEQFKFQIIGSVGGNQLRYPVNFVDAPASQTAFGVGRRTGTVAKDGVAEFVTSLLTAPNTDGTYTINLQMKTMPQGRGEVGQTFGQVCTGTLFVPGRRNDAICEDLNLKLTNDAKSLEIFAKMKNTGNTIWRQNDKVVVPAGESNALNLGFAEIENPTTIPGGTARVYRTLPQNSFTTITKTINLATLSPQPNYGTYNIAFRMKTGNEEFGETCRKQVVIGSRFANP